VLLLRLAVRSRFPTEWDGAQLSLGVHHFDVTQDSPNAPGYWSYVFAGRVVRALTHLSPHASLVVVTAIASAATGALLFVAGRRLGGDWLGWSAAAFWATSPVAWFYGSIVNVKVFDAVALAGLIVLALKARPGGREALWAAVAAGVATGFRPSSALVLAPLALYVLLRCCRRPRDVAAPLVAGAAAVASWLGPVSWEQPGGLHTLRAVNDFMFDITARKASLLYGAPYAAVRDNAGRALTGALVAIAPLLPVALLGLAAGLAARPRRWPPRPGVLVAAALPGVAVTVLIWFGTSGFLLAHLPATMLLVLSPAAVFGVPGSSRPWVRAVATGLVVAGSLLGAQRFLWGDRPVPQRLAAHRWLPGGLSRAEIRRVDADLRRYLPLARRLDPARDVLVFVGGNGYERFRPLSLVLPQFASHLVLGTNDAMATYRTEAWFDDDHRLEVPAGGRAVVLLERDDPGAVQPGPGGPAGPLDLGPGIVARAAVPGGAVGGLAVVADPDALRPKTDAAHRRPCGGGRPCRPRAA